ncbi:putative bifunctional diguanylate cyclase/phosphodiesterase [Flavisphingomonas formosensis]|uniref:putative bifunctional diguanylate cyclase/phosphodiesterase n=1 Tax=Flavisphingomonas formosensis TaxID=861534 RepID=UPI0018DF002D|nr:EAL domain-containing protein [Sphingomonas formosensis]
MPVGYRGRDFLTTGVTVAALLAFAATGGTLLHHWVDITSKLNGGQAQLLSTALLLNVTLAVFVWKRHLDFHREAHQRSAAEQRAQTLASRDPLTGLLNRRSLVEESAAAMARADRGQKGVAMLLIDLDHFKTVNDVHGHIFGDTLLCAMSQEIARLVPPSSLIARLGADEFAVAFLFEPGAPGMVRSTANRIMSRLGQAMEIDGVTIQSSATIGIARSERDCTNVDALMRRADIALHAGKKQGRNRVAWFDASMERELQQRNAFETGLRSGIPLGQIVPYYEQQIDLRSGRLQGFEVLARWDHPTLGLVLPDAFIPIAEECGLIGELSLSVMRQAFEEARNWDPGLTLSVNVSPAQLKDPWLAQKIVKLLVETGFPPSRLEIEITESSLFENLGLAQSIVGSLKNQGIQLSLDDFGTGYSSLAHLRALPFDRIKIDKSFVTSINHNTESAAIVNAIIGLGESLNLPITAEGVENAAIEARLRERGCQKGQGWYFGKPMPVTQVRRLLADKVLLPTVRMPEPGTPVPSPLRQSRAG